MKNKNWLIFGLALQTLVLVCGCKLLLPEHPNSQALKGEKVALKLITFDNATTNPVYSQLVWKETGTNSRTIWMTNSFQELYKSQFTEFKPAQLEGWKPGTSTKTPTRAVFLAAPLAAAAVGYAVDFIKKQMDQEATTYEAQFQSSVSDDAFWKSNSTNFLQNYCGFEIIRSVNVESNAFRLVCGMGVSGDGNFFRIAPLFQQTKKAKAKVLSDKWWTWPLAPWIWGLKKPSHEVDTKVDIELDGYWMDKDYNSKFSKLAAFPLQFNRLDIESLKPYVVSREDSKISGWMISVPPSRNDQATNRTKLGVFTLSATVTERDTSNAKQLLEQASKIVGDNQAKIIAVVTNSIP